MALNEGPCYTIINSKDSEPFNEMQIKQDLGRNPLNTRFHSSTHPLI